MSANNKIVKKRIGEMLLERGSITREQLEEALRMQKESKRLVGQILVELGYSTEEEVMICITTQYGLPYLPVENYEVDQEVLKSVPKELAQKYFFIPIDKIGNLLTIVASDVFEQSVLEELEKTLNCKIKLFVTTPSGLKQAIEKYYQK